MPSKLPASPELSHYRSILEAGLLGAAYLDLAAGRFAWANEAFARMLGYEQGEIEKIPILELTHADDNAAAQETYARIVSGSLPAGSVERRYRHKDGRFLWVKITATVVRDEAGKPSHVLGVVQDFSDRKRQELEFMHSERRLNAILDAVEDVVWSFSPERYRLEYMNARATERLYGRRASEFLENPKLWMEVVHPEDRELVGGIWDRLVSQGKTEDHYRIVRSSGEIRWVHARAWSSLGADGKPLRFEGVVRDVTESKLADLAQRESEARLRLVMESGRIGIWEMNLTTGEVAWSRVFRELIGVGDDVAPDAEVFRKMIHPDDLERYDHESMELRGGRKSFPAFRVIRPNGEIRWLQNVGRVVRLGEGPSAKLVGAIVDLTDARRAEELIEEQRAKMTAASKMSALGEMAGGLAHEINNPVAIIHGNAELLRQLASSGRADTQALERSAKVISKTAERIAKITRSLLAFARDAEQDPFKQVKVKAVIDETAEFCRERFRGHGIEFRIGEIDPGLEIECRPVQVSQVILNLLNNAHDAVENLAERWIRISAEERDGHVEIRVTDSGRGISAPMREKIFQPFFTTKDVGKGTGLGLSVAKGIVESHLGTLRLAPPGGHTEFVVSLPLRQRPRS